MTSFRASHRLEISVVPRGAHAFGVVVPDNASGPQSGASAVIQAIRGSGVAGISAICANEHVGGKAAITDDETDPTAPPNATGQKPIRGSAPPPYQRP